MGMAARAIGRTGGAAAIAALLLPACGGAGKEERPVAEVYDEKLYRADLMNMVPPVASSRRGRASASCCARPRRT